MARAQRRNTTRLFFNPACPTKKLHMVKRKKNPDVTRSGRKSNKPKILSPMLLGKTYTDGSRDRICDIPIPARLFETLEKPKVNDKSYDIYTKDNTRKACPSKKEINTYLSSLVTQKGSNCFVLDGANYMSTKELLKNPNVSKVDIANNCEETAKKLQRKTKDRDNVDVHSMTDMDFFQENPDSQYDLIYLDRCGWWEKPVSPDGAKEAVDLITKTNQLHYNGTLAITISEMMRTKNSEVSQALRDMETRDFVLIDEFYYRGESSPMATLVFKKV